MLTQNLTVTSNSTCTKPGASGALTYALVNPESNVGQTVRRIAATASTTPQELRIGTTLSGSGFKAVYSTRIGFSLKKMNTDLALTGGVTPSAEAYLVIRRPVQSAGFISDAEVKTLIGKVIDVVTVSGQLDQILNREE